jgi:hypothetical protein
MAREESDNKAHSSYHEGLTATSTKARKRPSKQRGSYGTNNGTVQKRTNDPHKKAHMDKK